MGNICPRRCVAQLGSRLGVFLTHQLSPAPPPPSPVIAALLLYFTWTPSSDRSVPRGPARYRAHAGHISLPPSLPPSRWARVAAGPWLWESGTASAAVTSLPSPRWRSLTQRAKLSRLPVESKREMWALPSSCFCRVLRARKYYWW